MNRRKNQLSLIAVGLESRVGDGVCVLVWCYSWCVTICLPARDTKNVACCWFLILCALINARRPEVTLHEYIWGISL